MANSLHTDMEMRYVVMKADAVRPEFKDDAVARVVFATGGFGCHDYTSGTAVFGYFADDPKGNDGAARMYGYDFERFATDEEIDEAHRRAGTARDEREGKGAQAQAHAAREAAQAEADNTATQEAK